MQTSVHSSTGIEPIPRVEALLGKMTLAEKVQQMCQAPWYREAPQEDYRARVRAGLGSFLNIPLDERDAMQKVAIGESRLGIPLIFGFDVIHGLKTVFPIPIGQAASFNMDLVERAAAVAAREAAEAGIDWTFAPMLDIGRDPRWGRVAETGGEDPYLTSRLGASMVKGFQGEDPSAPERVAACAKHYVGYGASESGKDYNTTSIPEQLLRELHLPPFKACVEAGALTLMTGFNDLNGVPASAHNFALRQVLKEEWGFRGFVVSDWASMHEMIAHGYCTNDEHVAEVSAVAGVDMEMASDAYRGHLQALVESGAVSLALVDDAVRRILTVKHQLGLFEHPFAYRPETPLTLSSDHKQVAEQLARESLILLKNDGILPLVDSAQRIAVIGSLADDPKNQLGCWAYGGDATAAVTALSALKARLGAERIQYVLGLETPRSTDESGFAAAEQAVSEADVALVFVGEHWNISGECRSRAFLGLPGAQSLLVQRLAETQTPLVLICMTGRPLTIARECEVSSAVLFCFHPGTMTGPALVDVLLGKHAPSGKLPISLPRTVGQIPIYYARKNTGRPPKSDFKGIPEGNPLDPVDFDCSYLDCEVTPLYPFGYGLSYTRFEYSDLRVTPQRGTLGESVSVRATLTNTGKHLATEVVQLYFRDLVASITRPVRELKGFRRVALAPGASQEVRFLLTEQDLAFYGPDMKLRAEAGDFEVFVGGDSNAALSAGFSLT